MTDTAARPRSTDRDLARVAVVGTSGSGKSSFARRLAAATGSSFVELDALYWNRGWRPTAPETFAARIEAEVARDAWVMDGNYSAVRDSIWSRASTLIWLDYPFRISFGRLIVRTIARAVKREECCNGNRESLRMAFLSRESILLWAIQSHPVYKREYATAPAQFPGLRVLRLRHPREAEHLLSDVEASAA